MTSQTLSNRATNRIRVRGVKPENHFKRILRREMDRRGLSNSDVARALWGESFDKRGYLGANNRDRISQYLRGRGYPNHETLKALADMFNMTPQALCPEAILPSEDEPVEVTPVEIAASPIKADAHTHIQAHTHSSDCDYESGFVTTKTDDPHLVRVQGDFYLNARDLAAFSQFFANIGRTSNTH